MDPIATQLLARSHVVVLDADLAASAATRPARDTDVDKLEAELLQLGFVMSLDLAMAIRRLPHQALLDLRTWMLGVLGGANRPTPPGTYAAQVLAWLTADQVCPWCGNAKDVGALDPCGHLVCRTCWSGGTFSGCAICHRRVAMNPFMQRSDAGRGELRILHLAFDLEGVAKAQFERMLASALSERDRAELETLVDAIGPKTASWLPAHIPVRETMAVALARLWLVAPDRSAMMNATRAHLKTATDVLRVAVVLMQGNAALVEPMKLASIPRGMRRAVLEALEQLPADHLVEDMRRRRGLWKRVGERLHPRESKLPNVNAAFAAVRGKLVEPTWGGRVEAALARGDARAAAALLSQRPDELLRRAGHLARVQPDANAEVLDAIRAAMKHGEPSVLLHLASRPFTADAARRELLARAARRRNFARAVIDRELPRWEAAAIHAAARANTIYVRGDTITIYKRRDGESNAARLARLHAGEHDGVSKIPPANAPTWFALVRDDIALPSGSEGYVLGGTVDLVAELRA